MSTISDFLMVTTPYLPGYKVRKVLGVASGLTARSRGVGKFIAGFQIYGREGNVRLHFGDGESRDRSYSKAQG